MSVKAFSSVSVIDYTDVGNIQLYLTSNQPTTVIYDPNITGTAAYTPNWSVQNNNLVITPVISYNGVNLALNAQGLVITYTRKVGSGSATSLTTGESVSGGILTVSANKLSTTDNLLTYICNISYTDPETGVELKTEATLTYTLLSMASELKSCEVTGESVFLYDSNRTIVGSDTITLNGVVSSNLSIVQWQYKDSNGDFVAYPTTADNSSITGTSLIVKATHDVFVDRIATIKLVTSDNEIYDIANITKIYDGASGSDTVTAVLTNETHYIPCNPDGSIDPSSWAGSSTQIYIYEGGEDVTSSWIITPNMSSNVNGSYNSSTHIFTPSELTANSAYVDFVCTKTNYSTLTKRFTIAKIPRGADGTSPTIYECTTNSLTLNINQSNVFTPSTVTFSAYSKTGSNERTAYSGRFKIYESTDGNTFSLYDTSNSDGATYEYDTVTANTASKGVTMLKAELYKAGGTSVLLDSQTVVVTRDGIDGDDGNDGLNGLSMGLGNYQDVVPCDTSGNASAAKIINIPFYAYAGITRVPVTATVGTLPSGVTVTTNTAGTASANGLISLSVASGATFGRSTTMSGEITITLQATYNNQTQSLEQKFTWTKNKQATNGQNAVILQIYSADGGIIKNSNTNTTLSAQLTSGTSDVTSSASYVWKKYVSGSYTTIGDQTSSTLIVTPSMVDDLAFFKCEATYPTTGGHTYSAYYTVDDLVDPYTAYTFAVPESFKNNQGFGVVYTRVYQNGQEVDPIKTTTFSDVAPSSPESGDFYYHLNKSNKSCILKKYNGSSWVNATETDTFTYNYYRIDKNGNSLDTTVWKTSRVFYVEPSMIDGRMQFICEVTD